MSQSNLQEQVRNYTWAIGQVSRAINSGKEDEMSARHRKEWATLWKALDNLIEIYERSYLQEQ